ncbi:hypothetical protein AB0J47_39515 [Nocardia sp. NPDC049737]|uniref:hypothetical protein n=1 Tax=Nocardia sp. NPDC049737 TaxID=3154358 RepID=UPI00342912D3
MAPRSAVLPGAGAGEAVPLFRWPAPPGADGDDGALTAPPGWPGAAGFPSAAMSPVAAPDPPDCPAPVGGCFGNDGDGIGRVGAAGPRSPAAFPVPEGALDPDEPGPDDDGNGRVASAAPSFAPAPAPDEVPAAGPGREGAPDPVDSVDDAGFRSVGVAGRGSAAAAGRPGFRAGLFSSFGSDT